MFQLYKTRNFSDLINDTFGFFKSGGKNYLKNYFAINGGLLLILVVLCFVVGRVFFANIFSGINNPGSQQFIEAYFDDNAGFFIGAGIIVTILILVIAVVNYSYPVLYLQLLEKSEKPTVKQIMGALKRKFGKAILFGLLALVTFVPLSIPLWFFSAFLFFILIGIPVAFVLFVAFTNWIFLSFYNYISTDDGYFTSMGKGWNMLFSKFWLHMGSTAIFIIILYALQFIFMIIPYIIMGVIMVTDTPTSGVIENQEDVMSTVGIMMLIVLILGMLSSFILGNLLFVNQGMIYYSCLEEKENTTLHNEIDLIGKDFE